MRNLCLGLLLTCAAGPPAATCAAGPPAAQTAGASLPGIVTHDNVTSAGRLESGVLTLSLWAGMGRWRPEGDNGPGRHVAAFGEEGGPLSIPSPLVRVPSGTLVRASIRNALASTLAVHGLCARPGACEPIEVPSGGTREIRFALASAGTYHYWATAERRPLQLRKGADSQLGGAIVVDASGADGRDRVFVMGLMEEGTGASLTELAVINGRSWPHTERLEYGVGERARWRIVNLTATPHAMHLHGFYFHVDAEGDGARDRHYTAADRPLAVTQPLTPGATAQLTWVPERAGNWLFHCHMLVHMMPAAGHAAPPAHAGSHPRAAGMAGLVLGLHVTGAGREAAPPDTARRRLRLVIEPDTRLGGAPSYKVDLVAGDRRPPRVSDRAVPGPVMVLTRGEPVAVEILNRLKEPTAVHWHGIELESYDDGVPGFGGSAGSVTPPIAPGGTFVARFTPSRAGTFIYHTHWHDPGQLTGGIYGPLIVLEPGRIYDPETDHIILISNEGPYRRVPDEIFAVNGYTTPRPLELKARATHRLRFINITADNAALTVQLLSGFDPFRWTPVGKDGAETPPALRREGAARQLVAVGETHDFELGPIAPTPVGLWMELRRGSGELLFQWPVRVR